jgi:catechol 2,3-dioxygenase-like lactoylglutathione lyase family enzyme
MPIIALQHFNIRCVDVECSRHFYEALLGLKDGPRPPFKSQGYWLYAGREPIVHLVQKPQGEILRGPLQGELDHIALECSDLGAMRKTLTRAGIPFHEEIVPRDGTVQIFLNDPDGVPLELNFPVSAQADT